MTSTLLHTKLRQKSYPILQTGRPGLREVPEPLQGHIYSKWQSQLNPGVSDLNLPHPQVITSAISESLSADRISVPRVSALSGSFWLGWFRQMPGLTEPLRLLPGTFIQLLQVPEEAIKAFFIVGKRTPGNPEALLRAGGHDGQFQQIGGGTQAKRLHAYKNTKDGIW